MFFCQMMLESDFKLRFSFNLNFILLDLMYNSIKEFHDEPFSILLFILWENEECIRLSRCFSGRWLFTKCQSRGLVKSHSDGTKSPSQYLFSIPSTILSISSSRTDLVVYYESASIFFHPILNFGGCLFISPQQIQNEHERNWKFSNLFSFEDKKGENKKKKKLFFIGLISK